MFKAKKEEKLSQTLVILNYSFSVILLQIVKFGINCHVSIDIQNKGSIDHLIKF